MSTFPSPHSVRILFSVLAFFLMMAHPEAEAASAGASGQSQQPVAATQPKVIKFSRTMSQTALNGRPDSDLVEFPSGRRMRLGDVRRLAEAGKRMQAPQRSMPAAIRATPAASGKRLKKAADLSAALKRSDNETVQLPSGRLATVGQIRFLQPEVEKRLGRKISAVPQRPDLSGPAIKVTAQSDWKEILQKPDGTVLESPDGTRITVGELKQQLKEGDLPSRAPARKSGTEIAPKRR